jgi:zinc and cadmium transporter
MWPTILIFVYCLLIAAASLMGGWLPSLIRLTHTRMQLMMSFVGGLMMGVAMLHMLPHAAVEAASFDYAVGSAVLGLLAMFFLIRIFHVHGHEPQADALHGESCSAHGHDHEHHHADEGTSVHRLSWIGLFIGLALHTLIDGIALAASVVVSVNEGVVWGLLGLGTFLAVVLHKPLDALAITSVMLGGGWAPSARMLVNVTFAILCPLGALAFFFGVQSLSAATHLAVGCALGFAGGAFLCISLADLLPEVQFHQHDRLKLSMALLLGVLLAWLIGFVEPEHAHAPHEESAAGQHADSAGHVHSNEPH